MINLRVDLISLDNKEAEYVLYLVENGPWGENCMDRIYEIQNRIYDTIDVVVGGAFFEKYPESLNKKVKIQIDAYGNPPPILRQLIEVFQRRLRTDTELIEQISSSKFVSKLRIVCGGELESFDQIAESVPEQDV